MKIWVDADACPKAAKDILFRAAQRTGVDLTLVANHTLSTPPCPNIQFRQVASGFDAADDWIVEKCSEGDLIISSDIPLADEAITKGAEVLTPRGEKLTKSNIKAKLTMRDFMDQMRGSGENTGGPPAYNQQDRQAFANQIDRWLAKRQKSSVAGS